ncbi:hypothetical protein CFP56_024126 [Quercus suber]|uniref:Uncharacterized protein n=1 Tax=Quercus suber TaxID=58331 RepID=A0AAW0K6U2_QUESU
MRPPNLTGPPKSINALHSNSSSSSSSSSTTPQSKSFSVLTMEKGGFESYNCSGHGKPLIISLRKCPHQGSYSRDALDVTDTMSLQKKLAHSTTLRIVGILVLCCLNMYLVSAMIVSTVNGKVSSAHNGGN